MAIGGGPTVPILFGRQRPTGIAVDAKNVYWTEYHGAAADVVDSCALSGCDNLPTQLGPTQDLALASNLAVIAVDSGFVYWTTQGNGTGTVKKASLDGKTVTVLASALAEPSNVAVDAKYVYWTNLGDGTIKRVAK